MRIFLLITSFAIFFVAYYLIFSIVGWILLGEISYSDIVTHENWRYGYSMFLGWWLSGLTCWSLVKDFPKWFDPDYSRKDYPKFNSDYSG